MGQAQLQIPKLRHAVEHPDNFTNKKNKWQTIQTKNL